jgi:hypothetical protein
MSDVTITGARDYARGLAERDYPLSTAGKVIVVLDNRVHELEVASQRVVDVSLGLAQDASDGTYAIFTDADFFKALRELEIALKEQE